MLLVDSDLSRLPLPDLVLSAVEQLPSPPPQVTVSAPSSPTRDAAFQFPECSVAAADSISAAIASSISMQPVPSPRPRPRRRLTSEGSILTEKQLIASSYRLDQCMANHHEHHCDHQHHRTCCCNRHLTASLAERQWATVGANLRNIADDFHAAKTKVSLFFLLSLLFFYPSLFGGIVPYIFRI